MSEIILTKEIAEQFHQDPQSVDLNSYGEISEDAAEVLSEFYYYFEHEKELTLLTAETLSRYDGFLKINSDIEEMFDELDPILANHQSGLGLWIEELSEGDAKKLLPYKGKLSFYNVESLTKASAEIISKHEGDELHIYGACLDSESLSYLAGYHGILSLEIEDLSEYSAKILASHKGGLSLNGSTIEDPFYPYGVKFDNDIISILSNCEGALSLGIKSLDVCAADALSNHEGELNLPYLYLICDKAASLLIKHKGKINSLTTEIFLSSIQRENPIIDINVAKKFIAQGGSREEKYFRATIDLEDYHGITAEAANFLINQDPMDLWDENHQFNLSGLITISTGAAEYISKYKGDLNLGKLAKLSDEASKHLSKHKGKINDLDPKEWLESLKNNE